MFYLKRNFFRFVITGMKLLSFLAIAGILFISCGTDSISGPELVLQGEWKQEGLDGSHINKIISSQNRLVLATEEGVFTRIGDDFSRAGLEDEEIVDVVLTGDDEMIAGIRSSGVSSSDTTLFKTTDGGDSWETVFSGASIRSLVHSARDGRIVYGSGQNAQGTLFFAATPDFGNTWEIIEMQNSPAGIRVNDIAAVEKEGREVLYLGTNKGLFSFTFRE